MQGGKKQKQKKRDDTHTINAGGSGGCSHLLHARHTNGGTGNSAPQPQRGSYRQRRRRKCRRLTLYESAALSPEVRALAWGCSIGATEVRDTVLTCRRKRRGVPAVVTDPGGVPCKREGPLGQEGEPRSASPALCPACCVEEKVLRARKVSPAREPRSVRALLEKHHAAGGECSETRVNVAEQRQPEALLALRLIEAEREVNEGGGVCPSTK
ncbi:hypothetical protein NDU88_005041 [Pleurodeles waltl]|uniref:Uncharacterized protein n=1 Tax=Pleurodeles waltl TaxID=8319 RepID=A0AAV7VM25_PLEWA|nr:hypothetical protein NDU88_005041 [Pleurodeles waltl]